MSEESPKAEEQPGKKKSLFAVVALVLGLAVGGGAGFAGIRMAAGGGSGGHAEESKKEEGHKEPVPLYVIENLVVNPLNSNGTRFLMATIAVEPSKPEGAEELKKVDSQLRDAVIRVLGGKTVEQLGDVGQRDSLKAELLKAAAKVGGASSLRQIYLPQFVLQ